MITVTCDRTDCGESFDVGMEGDWSHAPQAVRDVAIGDLPYSDLVYVYLPEGWSVDINRLDHVIHCPDHAAPR